MSFLAHTALIMLDKRYYSWIKNYKVNLIQCGESHRMSDNKALNTLLTEINKIKNK